MNGFLGLTFPTPMKIILSAIIFGMPCAPYEWAIGQESTASSTPKQPGVESARQEILDSVSRYQNLPDKPAF